MANVYYGGSAWGTPGAGFGYASGVTSGVNRHGKTRIWVNGLLKSIKIRVVSAGTLTNVAGIRVWRDDNIDTALKCNKIVGTSTVPSNRLVDNTETTLDTPIAVQSGDALGIEYTVTGGVKIATGEAGWAFSTNAAKSADGDWADSGSNVVLMRGYGSPCKLFLLTDSAFGGEDDTGAPYKWSTPANEDWYNANFRCKGKDSSFWLGRLLGLSPSMQYGGCGWSAAIAVADFAAVSPYIDAGAIVLINYGREDIITEAATLAAHQANMLTLVSNIRALGATPVRVSILPVINGYALGGGYVAVNTTIDAWNTAMASWCSQVGIRNINVDVDRPARVREVAGWAKTYYDQVSGDYTNNKSTGNMLEVARVAMALASEVTLTVATQAQVDAIESRVTTAIPNAAHSGAGGLPTVNADNQVAGVAGNVAGSVASVAGNVAGSVGSVTAPGVLTSAYDAAKTAATQASVNAIAAKTALITAGGITIRSPVVGQRYIEICRGRAHPASEELAFVFEDSETVWGDYAGAAIALLILDRVTSEVIISIAGVYAVGPPKTLTFEPTAAETASLTPGHRAYGFQLVVTPPGSDPILRAWGDATVVSYW